MKRTRDASPGASDRSNDENDPRLGNQVTQACLTIVGQA